MQDLTDMDGKEAITIWDFERNGLFDCIVLPHKPVRISWGMGGYERPFHTLHMTSDRRYLAAKLIDGSFVLYDRKERKVVLQLDDTRSIPRFTGNGTTLVLVPDTSYGKNQPIRWYQLRDGQWNFQREAPLKLALEEEVSQIGDQYLVTRQFDGITPEWLSKLPEAVQTWIAEYMLHYSITLRFRDLETGEVRRELVMDSL